MFAAVLTFVVFVTIVLGFYWAFVVRPEQRENRALRRRLKASGPSTGVIRQTVVKARERMSAVGPLDQMLARRKAVSGPIQRLLERSGLSITVGTVVLSSLLLSLLVLVVIWLFTSSFVAALIAAVAAAFVPYLYLRMRVNSRMAMFEEQFPEAIDLLARSLRAGHALPTALQGVGDEIPDPVGSEFRILFEQQNYGMSLSEALRAFADRVPVLDARFFVTAVLTQRETGGNLSEVLDNLSSVIRERFKVKRQVRVVSAHGRITGWVLGGLPPVLAFVLFTISPDHMLLLWNDPLGLRMLIIGIVLQVIGVLIIRRIVDVEY